MYIISIKRTRKEIAVQGQQELKDKSLQSYSKIHREGREKKSDFLFCGGPIQKLVKSLQCFLALWGFIFSNLFP